METPIYSITDVEEQSDNKPKEELERLSKICRTGVQIQIFFNDISVYKTKFHAVNKSFCSKFDESYKLQVSFIKHVKYICLARKKAKKCHVISP